MGAYTAFYVKHGRLPELKKCSCELCSCVTILFLLTFFIIFTSLTLKLTPPDPTCLIDQFQISTPFSDSNSTINNQTISFDLKLENQEPWSGIIYDPLNLTISYRSTKTTNKTMTPIAAYTFPGFYQGFGKTATRSGLAMVDSAVYNGTATDTDTTAIFRVKLDTRARYKSAYGIRKKHGLVVGGNFKVDVTTGRKVGKGRIKLTWINAAAAADPSLCRLVVVVVISTAVVLFVI